MIPWQTGTMLHPGAQRSEHRKNVSAYRNRHADTTTLPWQSGRQSGAWPQHHLGTSLPLARTHPADINHGCPNNLNSVSTFRGEDQRTSKPNMITSLSFHLTGENRHL